MEPDAVFTMKDEYKVPATGVLAYERFVVDPGFKEDKWVKATEARPGNRAVVHHILVYAAAGLFKEAWAGRRTPAVGQGLCALGLLFVRIWCYTDLVMPPSTRIFWPVM